MNFLSDEERNRLRAHHKKERDKRICDRIKAVLLYDKGWSYQEIAEALLLSDDAIHQHVDLISKKVLIQEDKMLNAISTIDFLKKIEVAYPTKSKVHLFCDNARYYRNKYVQEHLANSKVELHFLPPYSPNLNPIERMWKLMKERVMYNTYYQEFEDFRQAVLSFLKGLSNLDPESMLGKAFASRVKDKFRPIGAPLSAPT